MRRPSLLPHVVAVTTAAFHLLTANRSGIFRDELYYLACSEHLAFGYVDQPPLIAVLAWLARHVCGDSSTGLRALPALAAAGTVYLTAGMVRQLGGGAWALVLAAILAATAPIYVAIFGVLTMNAFDILLWAATLWALLRVLGSGDERGWLVVGLCLGIGLLNKLSIAALAAGIAVGLLVTRSWHRFRSGWLWLGCNVAFLLFLPHLLWQVQNGWPTLTFMANAMGDKNVSLSLLESLQAWSRQMNLVALPLVLAGLVFLLFLPSGRPYRLLGWLAVTVVAIMLSQKTKPYYLSPLYTLLYAAGSVVVCRVPARLGWMPPLYLLLCLANAAARAPLAKPLLPVETYVRYAARLGAAPRAEENQALGRLPQFFADRIGWPELAQSVAGAFASLEPAERARACIFGQNYGQAGAIDFYGPALGLPQALAAHNSYFLWGPRGCTGEVVVVIGDERADLEAVFESVELATTYTCQDCMPYENDKPIWICRRLRQPLAELWPRLRHFD